MDCILINQNKTPQIWNPYYEDVFAEVKLLQRFFCLFLAIKFKKANTT